MAPYYIIFEGDAELPTAVFRIKNFSEKRGKAILGIAPPALQLLRKYNFPGNIRELENAIEHAFVLCNNDTIEVYHLPPKIINDVAQMQAAPNGHAMAEKSEEAVIRESLSRHYGNRERTALELGMHRTTLWRKIQKYQIQLDK